VLRFCLSNTEIGDEDFSYIMKIFPQISEELSLNACYVTAPMVKVLAERLVQTGRCVSELFMWN